MTYSVYIIYADDGVYDNPAKALAGDIGLGEHMKNVGMDVVGDLIGMDFYDRYANKLTSDESVALTGEMVSDVKINTSLTKREVYKIPLQLGQEANTLSKSIVNTVTVKGRLLMPSASFLAFAAAKEVSKKKDTSKIWLWANTLLVTPADDNEKKAYEKAYYRKVLITVYSNTDQQFRAYVMEKAFVDSYEENFDSNGDGTFTLVMKEVIVHPMDFKVEGPSFEISALSVISQIDTAVSKAADHTKKFTEAVEVFVGTDSKVAKGFKAYAGATRGVTEFVDSNIVDGDLSVSNLADSSTYYTKTIIKDVIDFHKGSDTSTATSTTTSTTTSDTSTDTTINDTKVTDTTINDMMNNILNGGDNDGDDSN